MQRRLVGPFRNQRHVRWTLTIRPQPESVSEILGNDPHPDVVANMAEW